MSNAAILLGWNRSLPGREQTSAQQFQEFTQYLQGLMKQGTIESFEPVLLNPYGGSLNGFFFIKGEPKKLAELGSSPEWVQWLIKGNLHLDGLCDIRAATGAAVVERMTIWSQSLPR